MPSLQDYTTPTEPHANKSGGADNFPATGQTDRLYDDLSKAEGHVDQLWFWSTGGGGVYVRVPLTTGPRPTRPH